MIEPIMFFGLGLLTASLIVLTFVPLVHNRAVRLTMRRIEASMPESMTEIQADKDQLRAEFAMSTRRLEITVQELKAKTMEWADGRISFIREQRSALGHRRPLLNCRPKLPSRVM